MIKRRREKCRAMGRGLALGFVLAGLLVANAAAQVKPGRTALSDTLWDPAELRSAPKVVYGEDDRILPDVAKTMARVSEEVGGAEITSLADVGHFCQEERGTEIGELLAPFFAKSGRSGQ